MGNADTALLTTIPRTLKSFADVAATVEKILLDIAAQHRDNLYVKELLDHAQLGGGLDYEICRSFAVQDFDAKLSQHGIPHFILHEKTTGLMAVVTRDSDREAVLNAKNELLVEQKRMSRLSPTEFNQLNAGKSIEIIRARSVEEAKLFQQTAQRYGLSNIMIQKNALQPDKLDIYYTLRDKEKAALVMSKAVMATVGLSGERTTARISREIEFQNNMMHDIQDAEKDFYIVSQTNPNEFIHFSKEGLQYCKNGALIRDVERTSGAFINTARSHVSSIVAPVVLKKSEFEVSEKDRIAKIRSIKITTDRSHLQNHRAELEKIAKELIDYKQTVDRASGLVVRDEFYAPNASFRQLFLDTTTAVNETRLRDAIDKADSLSEMDRVTVKNYIGRELDEQKAILQSLHDESREFYIVSKENPDEYCRITSSGLEHFRGTRMIDKVSRENPDFLEIAFSTVKEIDTRVMLEKEEFETSKENRFSIVKQASTPLQSQQDRIEDLERAARLLIEKKLSLDNSEQIQIPSSFYNPNVSFNEFFEIEQVNDGEAKELVATLDELEDKEKILIKSYIKDYFAKVESIEVQSSYIDPELKVEDAELGTDRYDYDRETGEINPDDPAFDTPDVDPTEFDYGYDTDMEDIE